MSKNIGLLIGLAIGLALVFLAGHCSAATPYEACKRSEGGGNAYALLGQANATSSSSKSTSMSIAANKPVVIESECSTVYYAEVVKEVIFDQCDGELDDSCLAILEKIFPDKK